MMKIWVSNYFVSVLFVGCYFLACDMCCILNNCKLHQIKIYREHKVILRGHKMINMRGKQKKTLCSNPFRKILDNKK